MISQERLKELVDYDPLTGVFTSKVYRGSSYPGKVLGGLRNDGYLRISIDSKQYYSHRLAFLFMTGKMPKVIDHINRDRADNRWANLRKVTKSENLQNVGLRSDNSSGIRGVSFCNTYKKWKAKIKIDYADIFLGYFTTLEEATEARKQAEIKYNFLSNKNEDIK